MLVYSPSGVCSSTDAFRDLVNARSGQHVQKCMQCGKCTAGCPLSLAMDLGPATVIHACALGAHSIWLCVGCETCTARCPQDIDVARVMKACAALAYERGLVTEREVRSFHKAFLQNVTARGRLHEMDLMARLKLYTGQFLKDVPLGVKLFRKGKLRLLPQGSEGTAKVRRLIETEPER
jgi:heterodisulfide reductase subunit C